MKELANFIASLLSFYSILIVIRIMLTWMRPRYHGEMESSFSQILGTIVDPYLNWFKRFRSLRMGMIDFTPLVALIVLSIVQRIFSLFALSGKISVGILLATILHSFWASIVTLVLLLFTVAIGIRIYYSYKKSQFTVQRISMLDYYLQKPLSWIHSLLFGGREIAERTLLWGALLLTVVLYLLGNVVINTLVKLLVKLPF
ncbi:MAG: YggT family protein [Sphaerochaetaceae bacterium]|jgi:YggT family protein